MRPSSRTRAEYSTSIGAPSLRRKRRSARSSRSARARGNARAVASSSAGSTSSRACIERSSSTVYQSSAAAASFASSRFPSSVADECRVGRLVVELAVAALAVGEPLDQRGVAQRDRRGLRRAVARSRSRPCRTRCRRRCARRGCRGSRRRRRSGRARSRLRFGGQRHFQVAPSDARSTCTSPVRTHSMPSVSSSGQVRSCSGASAPSETLKWAIPSSTRRERRAVGAAEARAAARRSRA